jgi:phosphatidylserine decarboxylase
MLPSKGRVAATILRGLPRKRLSRGLGQLADVPFPSPFLDRFVDAYLKAYAIDLSDYAQPEGGYPSFDAFFTRHLLPGRRPLDADEDALLSPADGRLEDLGTIEPGAKLLVKGKRYDVGELLGDRYEAARFDGGLFAVVYLSPRDYHRVHAPATGRVTTARYVAGTLYPVNAIGLAHVPNLFAVNERVAIHQATERFGEVVSVMVGAIVVGRIGISFDPELVTNVGRPAIARDYGESGPQLARGAELGVFHIGSTVVLFTTREAGLRFVRGPGDVVRMGEALARRGGGRA